MSDFPPKRMLNASTGLGRVVLVTGGASPRGFGHTAAVLMARHGARVVVTDLKKFEEGGRKVVEEIKAFGGQAAWIDLDVTKEEEYKRAVEFAETTFGPLDVALLNAGIAFEYSEYMRPHDPTKTGIWDHPTSDWRRLHAVNMDGVYFGIKECARSMVQNNKAPEAKSIIVISSGAGFIGGTGFAYTSSKWSVRGMTKHAALFLAPFNVRCNSIHPGVFPTNILDSVLDNPNIPPAETAKIRSQFAAVHPLNRIGDPSEVANLILYLASTESSFTSGAEHLIDGALMTTAGYGRNPWVPRSRGHKL